MKAEKYIIITEVSGEASSKVRYGFGAAGEEVQTILERDGVTRISVKIEGKPFEAVFYPGKTQRLLDIKQKLKQITLDARR